jgi:hypothetical protein
MKIAAKLTALAVIFGGFLASASAVTVHVRSEMRTLTFEKYMNDVIGRDRASKFEVEAEPLPRKKQGQYYTVRWSRPPRRAPVEVVFEYRQARDPILRQLRTTTDARRTQFAVTGDLYESGGPVMAWRVQLYQGEKLIGERQSAMW